METIVTTSWDDGHQLDKKLSKLLDRYGIKGTFYVAKNFELRLSNEEIKNISLIHEVGAHTINHPILTQIDQTVVKDEIVESKKWLEELLSEKVKMFSYPRGIYNKQIKDLVKEAGFIGARTTKCFNAGKIIDSFQLSTTIHIYPHPFRRRGAKSFHLTRHLIDPLWSNLPGILKWRLKPLAYCNWLALAKATFDYTYNKGGIWHLWGHSWEIEKYDMWGDLEKILQYIVAHQKIKNLTNSQVIQQWQKKN